MDFKAPHPEMQLNVINARAIALIAGERDRWSLAGDQLVVDLHLGTDELPPGTRLQIGDAVIEVTEIPHTGCDKFTARFGLDAMRFVNSPQGRRLNLRGINAKVVVAGTIRAGDRITRHSGSARSGAAPYLRVRPAASQRRSPPDVTALSPTGWRGRPRISSTRSTTRNARSRRGSSPPTTSGGGGTTRRLTTVGCHCRRCVRGNSSWRCDCCPPGCPRLGTSPQPPSSGWRTCSTRWRSSQTGAVASVAAIPACTTCASSGEPQRGGTWGWRFGGHHVSVNHTIVDGDVVSSTPCFLGANPASSPLLGPHLQRPLAGAEDLGRELVRSLDDAQLARAVISPVAPDDLLTTNRPSVDPAVLGDVAGVRAAALDAGQRDVLRALLDVYVRRIPDDLADVQSARYASDESLDELSFAWAGSVELGQPHYYRVQGGGLLVEYDNTQNDANHIHSVWRDMRADFGGDVLAAHYARHH